MLVGHPQPCASIISLPRFFLILTLAVGIGKNASQVAILLGQSKIVGCQCLFLGCGKAGLRGDHLPFGAVDSVIVPYGRQGAQAPAP